MSGEIEHKAVEISDVKSGVDLKAGHRTIVIVNGAVGNGRYGSFDGQFDMDSDDPNADPAKKKHTWESDAAEAEEDPPGTVGGVDGAEFPRAHGRAGLPCLTCGAELRRIKVGARSTDFCPSCQPAAS